MAPLTKKMLAKAKRAGRRFMKRGGFRKGFIRPRKANVPEWASLTVIKDSDSLDVANTGQPYTAYNIELADFPRAVAVAQGYQYYRIKRVTWIFTPLVDTFIGSAQAPGGATATAPYLYYMIDRAKQIPTPFSADQLRSLGAIPRRLDEKTVVCSYKPSVLNSVLDTSPASATFVQYKMSPWLPTRDTTTLGVWAPSTVDHQGIVWIAENVAGATLNYKVQVKVDFQFKKPASDLTPAPGLPEAIEFLN